MVATSASAARELCEDLRRAPLDGPSCLELLDVPARLTRILGAEATVCFGLAPEREGYALEFILGERRWSPAFRAHVEAWYARGRPGVAAFEPSCPEPWQRNVALRKADLGARGALSEAAEGELFPRLGLERCDQIRALLCEGPRMLAWVGGFREAAFSDAERRSLDAVAAPLRDRLALERRLGAALPSAALTAALEALGEPAFVVSRSGRVEHANAAASALLEAAHAGTMERLREACAGRARDGARAVPLCDGPAAVGHLVTLPLAQRQPGSAARVARAAARLGLTAQQGRVLALVAEGLSNGGIAATLGISVRTVEAHVSALFDKAGVGSRAGLVARVLEL